LALAAVLATPAAACAKPEIVTGGGTLRSSAGTVDVECVRASRARIVGSVPDLGYTTRMIVAGPAGQASLIFENPDANDIRVAVHCVDSRPLLDEFEIEDTTMAD
jgi:hypothetical protein